MADLLLKTIAHIETDFPEKFGVPRQSGIIDDLEGRIIFEPEFRDEAALRCLEEFSHLWLIWGFSDIKMRAWTPTVRPPKLGGNKRVGVFASRSPFRPNPIGLSCVRLKGITTDKKLGSVIHVFGIDMVDGTPIYDIKPYIPYTDSHVEALSGFSLSGAQARKKVIFMSGTDEKLPEKKRKIIADVLAQDPHPSYKNEKNRVYHMDFSDYSISFSVDGNYIYVISVKKIF